jgi:hypothetical protein
MLSLINARARRSIAAATWVAVLVLGIFTLAAMGEEDAPPDASGATHKQTKIIRPVGGDTDWRLASFCLAKDGRIVAAVSRQPKAARLASVLGFTVAVADTPEQKGSDAKSGGDAAPGEVRLLDADGKLVKKWSLDFEPQAVNVGPGDSLFVAGDGAIARFDMDGKQISRAESPQVIAARHDPKELERRARALLEEQRDQFKEMIKGLQAQKEEFKAKDDKILTDEERSAKETIDLQIEALRQRDVSQDKEITDEQVKELAANLAQQDRRVNAIAASGKYVYTTTRASKGYGFRVWRSDLDLANAKPIAEGLSGCCGQMDVQCCGDDIVLAENSRYRVVRYDSEGKKLASFGKSSRDGGGEGFNGCCNPMNVRTVGDKLYVSESNGLVKLFGKDGKYDGIVGLAKVKAGCKSSVVDVSPDGSRVYYIDVENSAICLLERTDAVKTASR